MTNQNEWVKLSALPPGAIFRTMDGTRAIKTDELTREGLPKCILLELGCVARFNSDDPQVKRIIIRLVQVGPFNLVRNLRYYDFICFTNPIDMKKSYWMKTSYITKSGRKYICLETGETAEFDHEIARAAELEP